MCKKWFWSRLGIEAIGAEVESHLINLQNERKAKALMTIGVIACICVGLGILLRKYWDASEKSELQSEIASRDELLRRNDNTLQGYQLEIAQLNRQNTEKNAQIQQWLVERDKGPAAVKKRVVQLAYQIAAFAAEYRQNEPRLPPPASSGNVKPDSAEMKEYERNWNEWNAESSKIDSRYKEKKAEEFFSQFRLRILKARDDLADLGLVSEKLNEIVDRPTAAAWVTLRWDELSPELVELAAKIPQ